MDMLLSDNTKRVIDLISMFDNLNNIDKVRLSIHILEDLGFKTNYDVENIIKLLEEIMLIINSNNKKIVTNFSKYKHLLFISAKYMELSILEKKKFSVEMLFNIFEYDFKNQEINTKINKQTFSSNFLQRSLFNTP